MLMMAATQTPTISICDFGSSCFNPKFTPDFEIVAKKRPKPIAKTLIVGSKMPLWQKLAIWCCVIAMLTEALAKQTRSYMCSWNCVFSCLISSSCVLWNSLSRSWMYIIPTTIDSNNTIENVRDLLNPNMRYIRAPNTTPTTSLHEKIGLRSVGCTG